MPIWREHPKKPSWVTSGLEGDEYAPLLDDRLTAAWDTFNREVQQCEAARRARARVEFDQAVAAAQWAQGRELFEPSMLEGTD